jgi:hypothetical protein
MFGQSCNGRGVSKRVLHPKGLQSRVGQKRRENLLHVNREGRLIVNFVLGGMTVIFAYVFYSMGMEDEEEILEPELVVNGLSNKLIVMSCQGCRKLKNHREVEPGVFACVKCHRPTYTR